jgi:hypothetical protein
MGAARDVLAYEQRIYADPTDYYGKPRTLAAILKDKSAYLARWPIRSYALEPGADLHCNSDTSTYDFTGKIDWSADDPKHPGGPVHKSGVSLAKLGIKVVQPLGDLKIVRESGEVIERRTDNTAPAPSPSQGGSGSPADTITGPGQLGAGKLIVGGQAVSLFGIGWIVSPHTTLGKAIDGWLRQKGTLTCDPMPGNTYQCLTGSTSGADVGQFALLNGAARSSPDATPSYKDAEDQARQAKRGVWR